VSSIFFARGRRRVSRLGWAAILAMCLTGVGASATPHAHLVRHSEFINWPPELLSRAPALADSIAVQFGGTLTRYPYLDLRKVD
jgi:hypothetical protein